jgi:dihydrofolate reductase
LINLIVAFDKNRIIGKNNKIPWYIPEDLAFFKEITNNSVCIMGRNTWESLPDKFRPLPNRKNLIISQKYKNYPDDFIKTISNLDKFEDVWVAGDAKSALNLAGTCWAGKDIFVIGGYQVYKYFLENSLVSKMYITEINDSCEGDVYFPSFDESLWEVKIIRCFEKFNVYKYIKK